MPYRTPSSHGRNIEPTRLARASRRFKRLGFEPVEARQMLAVDAVDDVFSRSPDGGTQPLDVLDNDDGDGSIDFVSVTQGSLGGFVGIFTTHQGQEELRYSPRYFVNTTETFTYTISDDEGNLDTATVTVHLGNDFLLGGLHPGGGYFPGVTVPGELNSRVIGFHDPDPNVTHTAVVRWADGVVFQAHVTESSNAKWHRRLGVVLAHIHHARQLRRDMDFAEQRRHGAHFHA